MAKYRKTGGLLMFTVILLTTACTAGLQEQTVDASDKSSYAKTTTAKVTRSNITPVLSINSSVTSNVTYTITSPIKGVVAIDKGGTMSIIGDGGKPIKIDVPELSKNSELLVEDGALVPKGLPIIRSIYSGFALAAQVTGRDVLKLRKEPDSARAQISGSGSPFDCQMLDPVPYTASTESPDSVSFMYCIIPLNQPVISGLQGVIAIRFPTIVDALVLPVEAVAGSLESGTVNLNVNGVPVKRNVTLGSSNGAQIQITEGLKLSDQVFLPSPSLIDD